MALKICYLRPNSAELHLKIKEVIGPDVLCFQAVELLFSEQKLRVKYSTLPVPVPYGTW